MLQLLRGHELVEQFGEASKAARLNAIGQASTDLAEQTLIEE